MSLHGTYDDNNLFAKILRGEIPAVKAFEDDVALAFMDIFPQSRGHRLVVPKERDRRGIFWSCRARRSARYWSACSASPSRWRRR